MYLLVVFSPDPCTCACLRGQQFISMMNVRSELMVRAAVTAYKMEIKKAVKQFVPVNEGVAQRWL